MLYSHEPHLHICSFPSRNMHYICFFAFKNEVGGGKHFPFSPLCSDRFSSKGGTVLAQGSPHLPLGFPGSLCSRHILQRRLFPSGGKGGSSRLPGSRWVAREARELPAPPKKRRQVRFLWLGGKSVPSMCHFDSRWCT